MSNVNFLDSIKKNKKLQIVLVVVIAIFIIITLFFSSSSKDVSNNSTEINIVDSLEKRLSETLSKVKGAGKVSVVITVESGMETVLAMKTVTEDTVNGKKTETTPILVNGKTVVLKEMYPKVQGVLIVAEGAGSITVLKNIQQATMSLLDININQIEILTMK